MDPKDGSNHSTNNKHGSCYHCPGTPSDSRTESSTRIRHDAGVPGKSRQQKETENFWLFQLGNAILAIPAPIFIILGSLAGDLVSPRPELAMLPFSIQVIAAMAAAAPLSLFMERFGRRAGFCLGAMAMAMGGLSGAYGVLRSSFALLCTGHAFFGIAISSINFFRFAAAEIAPGDREASAISLTLAIGLLFALAGPAVFKFTELHTCAVPFFAAYLTILVIAVAGVVPLVRVSFESPPAASAPRRGRTRWIPRHVGASSCSPWRPPSSPSRPGC